MTLAARAEASEQALTRAIDAGAPYADVEAAAATAATDAAVRRRARTIMLYRMARVLTAHQKRQLVDLARRRLAER